MQDNKCEVLAVELGQCLLKRKWYITVAESCTGGELSGAITSVAGSSKWFQQGLVAYGNEVKHQQLGVNNKLLEEQGAVSGPVVIAMAQGALQQSQADIAIAVSGIAGPDGGSSEKPVGTVWVAWATKEGRTFSHVYYFSGNRSQIRLQTVKEALKGANVLLSKDAL